MILSLIPKEAERIIVAPLNWGLGHAARCIPIIRELIAADKEVILASDGAALQLLRKEFPETTAVSLPAYKVQYKHQSLFRIMLDNGINVLSAIRQEKKACEKIVREYKADLIISDSRFGFRSEQVPSYIISHQLNPQSSNPILKAIIERGNRHYLNQFDGCWVPDDADHKLSGVLSQSQKVKNIAFIGPLSRLKQIPDLEQTYDLGIFLSGPEPARTQLEQQLISLLQLTNKRICLVRGTEKELEIQVPNHWKVLDLVKTYEVNSILLSSKRIVSRSGYTSVMDYYSLGISAYLIPTPGQTEQEYLAAFLNGKYGFTEIKDLKDLLA